MNNKYILVGVVVVVLLGVWGVYSARVQTTPPQSAASPTPTNVVAVVPTSAASSANAPRPTTKSGIPIPTNTQTYHSIITQTGSHQCDYTQSNSVGHISGVVYIADSKMRAELRTAGADASVGSLAVYDGRYLYVWKEGQTTGTRTQPSSVAELPLVIPQNLESGSVLGKDNETVSWDCHAWLKDAKLLAPPSYVSFH